MRALKLIFALTILSALYGCVRDSKNMVSENIKPYAKNPAYWQYNGQPVLLLGASDNDNLFQNLNIESHLDSLHVIGGNYIRNTMSDRDEGDERAFFRNADGKYDLDKWNDKYWERFENMLKIASERDIIIQIEIWDRFDHSGVAWLSDPYHPKNNINYDYAEAGLDSLYQKHAGTNEQPFFFTVPSLNNNQLLLKYQQAFVKKLLSHSLDYGNVLYCIDNETSGVDEWATYWAGFLKENSNGKDIYITEMWDDWDIKSDMHKRTLDHPERYAFIDMSQNSHNTGQLNWDNARYIFNYIKDNPRPVNSTKIYGNDQGTWTYRGITTGHAVQTFFRNILGGFASSRFHRPPYGLGLTTTAINSIKTIRKIEEYVKMWDINPRMDLLEEAGDNIAYLSAREGEYYLVYFPKAGNVRLNLAGQNSAFALRWIDASTAEWTKTGEISGGNYVDLAAENENGSFAVLVRNDLVTAGK